MRRTLLALAALLVLSAAARAEAPVYETPDAPAGESAKGPDRVDPAAIRERADALHDALNSPATTESQLHHGAAGLFEAVQRETPVFRPSPMPIARERVDGRMGTVDGMVKEAQRRWDHYKMTAHEVPNADLEASIQFARRMREEKRAEFDPTGLMSPEQMGEFRYAKDKLTDGVIELNRRLALIATRIGEAFSYATLVHEGTHAKAREAGRLDPKKVVDGELEAYRAQYFWLKALDPKCERMAVLHSTLTLWLKRHPTDEVSRMSLKYLDHLLMVYDTDGEDAKIKDMIKRLGYEDGDHDKDGGVREGAGGIRA